MNKCHMIHEPHIVIVYIFAMGGADGYRDKAQQFVETYLKNPPGLTHDTLIVCNGVPPNADAIALFNHLPNVKFLERDDSGWDIGGYQHAARTVNCDMMVFFGGHTYFRKPNWLVRMWEVFAQHGDTLYGCTGNQGDQRVEVYPHVRTTAFWCSPALLNAYPYQVTTQGGGGQRYAFEHGKNCLSNWIKQQGREVWIVTFEGIYPVQVCDSAPGGYHQNLQENLLVGDRLTCGAYYPHA